MTPSPSATAASQFSSPAQRSACAAKLPRHFSGIAVQGSPATSLATYSQTFSASPQIVEFYNSFGRPFNSAEATLAVSDGEIPFIQLNPRHVSTAQVASGAYDPQIKSYANAVKAFPCKVILSFGHEMNGWWYPWGLPDTTPQEFIRAWRHIHDIFANAGATNVIWSWDPSHQHGQVAAGKTATKASDWYPGDAYVNWIGLDGYLLYNRNGHAQNFRQVFSYQLQNVRKHSHGKPVFIAETGAFKGPALASQIAELFSALKTYHLMGLIWFDAAAKHDYRLGPPHNIMDAAYQKGLNGL